MDITFLLGNGFDMQLGMKTGYRSFLEWYTVQPTTDSDIAEFREYLKDEKANGGLMLKLQWVNIWDSFQIVIFLYTIRISEISNCACLSTLFLKINDTI